VTGRIDEEIIGAAFKRLLRGGMAVTVTELAGDVGQPPDEVRARVTALGAQGRLRLEDDGRVAGAAGLSVGPDRHEIEIGGRRFWTWCAYDFLGIFGALRAAGVARTVSPTSGEPLEVHFERGVPLETQLVLFRPSDDHRACCANVYEEWCPNSNLFESENAAARWSRARGLAGRVLPLDEAAEVATASWAPLVERIVYTD
jgi:alkylmercury lyase